MALRDHGAILWIEVDIHITTTLQNLKATLSDAKKTGGILLYGGMDTKLGETHPNIYKYLPVIKKYQGLQANASPLLLYNTPQVRDIMKYWIVCALYRHCIAPAGASKRLCVKRKARVVKRRKRRRLAMCHRFDKSALNILLWNKYKSNVFLSKKRLGVFHSSTDEKHRLKICRH